MITLDVKTDIAKALKQFQVLEPRQFPFIVALAMNRTMKIIRDQERAAITKAYDRPTPRTLGGLYTRAATKQRLEALIALKDDAPKGTAPDKYLKPTVEGGSRRLKAFEQALKSAGYLPEGMFCVPAKDFPLDRYGNIPGSYITRMLSYLRASRGDSNPGLRGHGKRRAHARRQSAFYVINGSSKDARGLPWGIYERGGAWGKRAAASALGINSRLVIAFVKAPRYQKQFRFHEIAEREAKRLLPAQLKIAAEEAIRTSRDPQFELNQLIRLLNGAGFRT